MGKSGRNLEKNSQAYYYLSIKIFFQLDKNVLLKKFEEWTLECLHGIHQGKLAVDGAGNPSVR
jgi:hypothetical protein